MMGFGMMGFGMIFFWLLLVAVVVFIVRMLVRPGHQMHNFEKPATPKEILEKRYARGEINQEQYKTMLSDLNNN